MILQANPLRESPLIDAPAHRYCLKNAVHSWQRQEQAALVAVLAKLALAIRLHDQLQQHPLCCPDRA